MPTAGCIVLSTPSPRAAFPGTAPWRAMAPACSAPCSLWVGWGCLAGRHALGALGMPPAGSTPRVAPRLPCGERAWHMPSAGSAPWRAPGLPCGDIRAHVACRQRALAGDETWMQRLEQEQTAGAKGVAGMERSNAAMRQVIVEERDLILARWVGGGAGRRGLPDGMPAMWEGGHVAVGPMVAVR